MSETLTAVDESFLSRFADNLEYGEYCADPSPYHADVLRRALATIAALRAEVDNNRKVNSASYDFVETVHSKLRKLVPYFDGADRTSMQVLADDADAYLLSILQSHDWKTSRYYDHRLRSAEATAARYREALRSVRIGLVESHEAEGARLRSVMFIDLALAVEPKAGTT